ncbi:unnamed protein product [Closterium sp. NIES-65]|nr:unnamed protein product [Closterium sp. NIES-65]
MENVRESSEDYILQGNRGKLPVTGEGDVVLRSPYGVVKLESVLLVADLKVNLVSQSQLDDLGCKIFYDSGEVTVFGPEWEKYADGYFSDGFYEMNLVATNDMDEIYEDPESVNVNRQLQQQQGKGEQKGQQKGEQRGEQREVRLLGNSLVALFGSVGTGSIQASLLLLSCDPCGPHFVAVLRCHKCCAALPQAVSLKGRPERDVLERLLRDSVLPCDPTPWLCCAATSGERGGWVGEEPTLLEEGSTGTGVLVGGRACAGAAALL